MTKPDHGKLYHPSLLILALLAGMMIGLVAGGCLRHATAAETESVITFYYPTGNPTFSGTYPEWGTAAASWNVPLGSQFRLWDGHIVTITDRGLLGWSNWIDVYCPWHLAAYCEWAYAYHVSPVEILRWGW